MGRGVEENGWWAEIQREVTDVGGLLWFSDSSDCYGRSLENKVLGSEKSIS